MILNQPERGKWGIPYQGSKTKLVEKLARYFPPADHFYDLFGGGFSVTHYMMMNRRKSFKHFHYNEIRPGLCELIQDAIAGKYSYDNFKPEWITRERFEREKESNAYIKIIWSFGNNGKDYLFGKDIEQQKRSMHQAVVFDEFDSFMIATFGMDKWPNKLTIEGKRLYLKRICAKRIDLQRIQRLQQLEQLERIQRLERIEQLQQLKILNFTNLDYREVLIHPNSVIYCDIPYQRTADYGNSFNHTEFFNWAAQQVNPLFISEYQIRDPRFHLLKEISHRSTFSATKDCGANASGGVAERLYCNDIAMDIVNKHRNKSS